jgi:hypothetical protein
MPIEILTLDNQYIHFTSIDDKPIVRNIQAGNGGYRIVCPKQLYVFTVDGGSSHPQMKDYTDQWIKMTIQEGILSSVKAELLSTDVKSDFLVYFMLVDKENQKRILRVEYTNGEVTGNLFNLRTIEDALLEDNSYWQE